ncbi:MAG TPA: low molecular weight protein-tyrosine-phosphatase [Polyangia bacterium]|jgi:protein-tyrosine phosphatase|nr:low molecular weight protein-tyrosine-phosphatase [Polyangia bacterium]
MVRVCFVCLGNICRSPTAEAVMRHLVRAAKLDGQIQIESAGTGDWHVGEPRDRRSQATGAARGVPLTGRAQLFSGRDFDRFDHVIAMDRSNLENLRQMAPSDAARAKLHLLRQFENDGAPPDADVPDPYYGGARGFEQVFDICEAACAGFLDWLRREHGL